MKRRAGNVFGAAEQLEIFQRAVAVVAVFPPQAMPFGNRAVRVFPNSPVNKLPICAVRADAGIRLICDLADEIPVGVELHRSDRAPVVPFLAFLELRLAHASGRPSRPTHSFVRGNLPFVEAVRTTNNAQPFAFDVIE